MGLGERRVKQRLVGSASTRNSTWANDASLPGQRMLAQMGWKEGEGLGNSMKGMTQNLTVSLKLDNKGIGAARYEKETRAAGKDVWVGGGGDLGSLFDRLNAANSASASPAPPSSDSEEKDEAAKTKKTKKAKKDTSETKEQRKERKRAEKEAKKAEKKRKRSSEQQEDEPEKSAKKSKMSKKISSKEADKIVAETVAAAPALADDRKAIKELKQEVQAGKAVRLAHRAKFLRAKRMVGNDLASVNEIFGITSASGSPTPSGTCSPVAPATPKTYPGPGGSQIALVDVDRKLAAEALTSASPSESDGEASSSSEEEASSKKKRSSSKKERKEEKKQKKSSKKDKSKVADQVEQPAVPPPAAPMEKDESGVQIGTNARGLGVFEYLSQRLMVRKAQIAKMKKAEGEAIYARAALIRA